MFYHNKKISKLGKNLLGSSQNSCKNFVILINIVSQNTTDSISDIKNGSKTSHSQELRCVDDLCCARPGFKSFASVSSLQQPSKFGTIVAPFNKELVCRT